jgi:hypothetical protein
MGYGWAAQAGWVVGGPSWPIGGPRSQADVGKAVSQGEGKGMGRRKIRPKNLRENRKAFQFLGFKV